MKLEIYISEHTKLFDNAEWNADLGAWELDNATIDDLMFIAAAEPAARLVLTIPGEVQQPYMWDVFSVTCELIGPETHGLRGLRRALADYIPHYPDDSPMNWAPERITASVKQIISRLETDEKELDVVRRALSKAAGTPERGAQLTEGARKELELERCIALPDKETSS